MQTKKFNALTGLRAVAAIMVFLYHNRKTWIGFLPNPLLQVLNEFHTGVSVFFVLSGFLIAYTYGEQPTQSRDNYRRYLLVRLARIFPFYLLLLSVKYIHLGFPPAAETGLTYTLMQGLFDGYSLSGIPQAWSLTTELCFYILAPFIAVYALKNIYKAFGILLLLFALTLGIGWVLELLHYNKAGFLYDGLFVLNTVFTGRFAEFYFGMLLALHIKGAIRIPLLEKMRYQTIIGGTGMLLAIIAIAAFQKGIYTHGVETYPGTLIRNLVFPTTVALLINGLIRERTWLQWLLGSKVAVLMGNASFIFYLVHINYVNNQLWGIHHFPDRNFCLLWLISIVAYLLIEKPLYEKLKYLIRKK